MLLFFVHLTVELASWGIPLFTVVRVLHSSTFFEASIASTKTATFRQNCVCLFPIQTSCIYVNLGLIGNKTGQRKWTQMLFTVELASWELPSFAVVRASHASTFFEASIPSTKTAKFGRKLVSLL